MSMIQAVGIVAEYNPFHNGHAYHIAETKRLTDQPVIAIMSGSFMQRGEPALLSPWLRAQSAVLGGADLVLQLPVAYSLRSAQYFAQGAVESLAATGCVNHLSCGVESPSNDFFKLAQILETPTVQMKIKEYIANGESYARACANALSSTAHSMKTDTTYRLTLPNDILALSYCQAIIRSQANISPLFIKRQANQYNDLIIEENLASASAIRKNIAEGDTKWEQAVPDFVAESIQSHETSYDENTFWMLIRYQLRKLTPAQIASISQCSEGLENVLKQASNCNTLQQALSLCTKKRYTTSRIRRLLCQILLGQPRQTIEQSHPAYLRVLAFNDTGRALLKQMQQTCSLPVITKLGKNPERNQSQSFADQISLDILATDIWQLISRDLGNNQSGMDYINSPLYIKNK